MKLGIYENWPAQVYHEADGINASFLKAIVKNTLFHVKGGHQGSAIARKTADIGTAFHAMELEQENNLVYSFPTTLRKGEAWANAYAESEAQGHTLLPQPDFEMVQNMVAAIRKNQQYNKLRNAPNGKRELSVFAEHKPTGQLIKCSADLFVPDYGSKGGVLVDLKTCARAETTLFSKDAFEYGYHIQAAHYMLVCRTVGLQVGHFAFAVVEKSKPYATNFLIVEPELLDRATVIVEQTLREIKADENNPNPTTGWPSWSYLKTPWWMKENSKIKEKNH